MGINLSTDLRNKVAFRSTETTEPKKTDAKPEVKTSPLEKQPARDDFTAPVSMKTPEASKKAKTGPIQGFKNFIAGCKKLFNNIAEYGKATLGGLAGGAVIGLGSFGTLYAINFAKKANAALKKAPDVKPFIGKNGMIAISTVIGLGVLGKSLFDASLNASEKNAKVEDRWMGRKNSVRDKI